MTIDHINLIKVDLNLLVALDALLTERSVTRAAARLGLGQSALSSNLGRLRKLLGDELLTRAPDGMQLTPRAVALIEPVRSALRQFQCIVHRELDFDAATVERTITVAMPGSMEVLLGPRLLALLRAQAPGIQLLLRTLEYDRVLKQLDADQLDLAIGVLTEGQTHHKIRPLYRDGYLCLFNPALLGFETPIGLEEYLRFPHVLTSLTDTQHGVVDDALDAIGRRRWLAATSTRFVTVPFLVQTAPVMTTMVAELATFFAKAHGLATSPVPVTLEDFTVSMLWHSSYDHDPAHRWLRETVLRLSREIKPHGPS